MTEAALEPLPAQWRAALDDLTWAERFGWPPSVVDEQPAARMTRLAFVFGPVEEGRALRAEQDANNSTS